VTGDKLAVMDNGSMNGVLVNGRKIPSNTLCELRVGDEVSFSSQLKTIVTGVGS
jgi:pSer/pThr/pTyr-binding forkhead associated (FHA) protein